MGKRGPQPKPTAQKRREGNPGHQKLNDAEPVYDSGKGHRCPAHLKGIARATWLDLAPQLESAGVLLDPDRRMLELLCAEYARYREAEVHIAQDGPVFESEKTGFSGPSGWLNVSRGAFDRFMKAAAHFGMSPSSRSGVEVKPKTKAKDAGGVVLPWDRTG